MDEVMISATVRSGDWIKTCYNNQVDATPGDWKFIKSEGTEITVPEGTAPVPDPSALVLFAGGVGDAGRVLRVGKEKGGEGLMVKGLMVESEELEEIEKRRKMKGNKSKDRLEPEYKVYGVVDNIGYASNPSFFKTISFPSKSSGASFSLSSLENDFNKNSGSFWGILNHITENTFSLGNKTESVKSLTFSSSRNLSWKRDVNGDIISTSGQISSVVQSSLDVLFTQRREILNNLLDGDSTFQHLQYLPNHNPGPLESGLSMTDFTVRNNILTNFDSHNSNIDSEYINNFGLLMDKSTSVSKKLNSGFRISHTCTAEEVMPKI